MLQQQKKNNLLKVFLLSLCVATAFILPAIIAGGGILYLTNDFSTQQHPFYVLCHEAIRSGNLYSCLTGLGNDLISSYSFYTLGSPFFLITLPFPTYILPYLLGPLLILKFALSAVTSYLYIKDYVKNTNYAVLGGILYAFSGYLIFNMFYNHFLDVCVFAPLLLWALDRAMKDKNRGMFAVAVFLSASVNYVFFVGSVVFCIIYFVVKLISGEYKLTLPRFITLAVEAVLGFAMSSVLLLPAVLSLMSNTRVSELIPINEMLIHESPVRYFEIIRAFLFPTDTPHVTPFFYKGAYICWTSPAIYIPLFSIAPTIALYKQKGKSFLKILFPILLVFMFIPLLNSSFSAFNSSYYARWFYMPALMLSLSSVKALENTEEDNKPLLKSTLITFVITILAAVIFMLFPAENNVGKIVPYILTNGNLLYTTFYVTAALAGLVVLYVVIKAKLSSSLRLRILTLLAAAFIIITAAVNVFTLSKAYPESKTYEENIMTTPEILLNDRNDNYRIDTMSIHYNTHMWWKTPSLATFNSTISSSEVDFYRHFKYDRYVATKYGEGSFALRYLLSVKYVFYEKDKECLMPSFSYIGDYNGFSVYENQDFVPMGFTFSHYMTYSDLEKADSLPLSRLFIKAMLLNDEQTEKYKNNLTHLNINSIIANSSSTGISSAINDAQNLQKTAGHYFEWNKNGFTSKITLPKENLVFYSVPYDKGFKAYVNGKEADIEKVHGGFMAVLAPQGENTIEFKYYPVGLNTGAIISISSLTLLIIYVLIHRKKKTK